MIFRDTTWKGARVEEGSTWRNSVALYQVVHEGRTTSRADASPSPAACCVANPPTVSPPTTFG